MKLRERSPLWRRVIRTLGRQLFRLAENNDDPRLTHNGEGWLLRQLMAAHAGSPERQSQFRVFDAGANAGNYTRLVLEVATLAGCAVEVHAFEPSPHCLEILRREFGAQPEVRIVGAALRGLSERLRPEIVDVIQFEYGGTAIDAGTTLRDVYRLLESRGYVMAKLFPTAGEVRGYRPWMEHYAYANYVALSPRWRTARRGT